MHRFFATLCLVALVAACNDTPTSKPTNKAWDMPSRAESLAIHESCKGDILCYFPKSLEQIGDLNTGRNMGGGAVLRDIKAHGSKTFVRWDVPQNMIKDLDEYGFPIGKRSYEASLKEYLKNNYCGEQNSRAYFAAGGQIILETYLPSGERFSRSVASSC
ncbi:hypothetical protein [Shimia sp.]|uniref:hypothetical protein n=1 Tax=Shimia sp. TaxID=1954381 RepID=UPI003B8DA212